MKKIDVQIVVYLVIFTFLFMGCASTTMLRSNPEGASVYIGDIKQGVTPYKHTDSKILYTTERVRIEKEGYKPLKEEIKKDTTLNVGALVGAFFVGVPIFWVLGYPEEYYFELELIKH